MTSEAQRIAIAEACPTLVAKHEHGPGYVWNRGPLRPFDPLSDLNAMHEVEKTLTLEEQIGNLSYMTHLRHIIVRDIDKAVEWFNLATATATQRAEAFLRTINKWDDSK